jgi:hypothetical protein
VKAVVTGAVVGAGCSQQEDFVDESMLVVLEYIHSVSHNLRVPIRGALVLYE